jgi:hypothetical protein
MGLFDGAFPDDGNGGILPYGLPKRPPGLPDWLWQNPRSLSAMPLGNARFPDLPDWPKPQGLSAIPVVDVRPAGPPDWLWQNPQPLNEMPIPFAGPSRLPGWLWPDTQRLRPFGLPDSPPRNPQSPSDLQPNATGTELPFADRWGPVQRAMPPGASPSDAGAFGMQGIPQWLRPNANGAEPGSAPSGGPAFRAPGAPSSPEWLAPYVGAEGQPATLGPHVPEGDWRRPPRRNIWGNVPYVGAQGQPTDVGVAFTYKPDVRISPEMNGRLSRIGAAFKQATGKTLHVHSGIRSAAEQAEAMYNNFKGGHNKEQYKNQEAFKKIREAYDKGVRQADDNRVTGKDKDNKIIGDMTRVIQSQVDSGIFISRHMLERGADMNPKMNERDKAILKQIVEGQERGKMDDAGNHLHLQFD